LRIKMVRGEIDAEKVSRFESRIRCLFDNLDQMGRLSKHIIWNSVRNE
jgi:hypothetical protein